jgi:hypothetical protein
MGVRLVQRRRPQLDGRLPATTFRRGRSVHRCGLFRARPEPYFHGEFDSQNAASGMSAGAAFCGSACRLDSAKTFKIVVRMQHTQRTFIETAGTPKKAAHACLFCFTTVTPQTTV